MEYLSECLVCSGKKFEEQFYCIDYTVSHETFKIFKCTSCGFFFTNPRPKADEIGKYYQSDEYISHSGTKKGLINLLYHVVRSFTLKRKYNIISQFTKGNKEILDIGSGTGEFLNYCKNKGANAVGIEPSETGREAAIKNYSLNVFPEEHLNQLKQESFNVITMWHVLEHVHELKNRVKQIKSLLRSGGHSFIAVPNHLSCDAAHYKQFWAAYDVPRHLYHFDKQSITRLFEQEGLKLVKMLPMKMDAFYVSMLSEKYKSGKTNYLNAMRMGLKSNREAGGESEKYSSVIYVFEKASTNQ